MSQDRLYKLLEQQRKRQIAALLVVCTPEEKECIKNPGRLPVLENQKLKCKV